jgi:hypothetical protein
MKQLTLKQLRTPKNAKELRGQPMLFAKPLVAKLIVDPNRPTETIGKATLSYNIMTGQWFVQGQSGTYLFDSIKHAIQMMKSDNYFAATGRMMKFNTGLVSELCEVDSEEPYVVLFTSKKQIRSMAPGSPVIADVGDTIRVYGWHCLLGPTVIRVNERRKDCIPFSWVKEMGAPRNLAKKMVHL